MEEIEVGKFSRSAGSNCSKAVGKWKDMATKAEAFTVAESKALVVGAVVGGGEVCKAPTKSAGSGRGADMPKPPPIQPGGSKRQARSAKFPWSERPLAVEFLKSQVIAKDGSYSATLLMIAFDLGIKRGFWSSKDRTSVMNKVKKLSMAHKYKRKLNK